ncbi:MAG: helix-turn-helix transcriptional regulator [Deltaproteobacteria bacterium]|nr:helix-turn-helix transcriptional regulator [Deltaproteobacteria bacterium]MBK8716500.1 helix-turn-helix transcriptional regulator [Deltaproteobacteria bacterium]MBP7287310.1 helix-turn-helix transcriptional regulator [Nannocystaceae bacterium]
MARARQFDVEIATDAAVELFWDRGYTACSVRDLCEAMALQPGSFYAAFGSKQACFRRALERYLAREAERNGLLRGPGPEAIRAWLDTIASPRRRHRGCLLVNTAVEGPHLDAPTRAFVAARMAAMEHFFTACLGGGPDAHRGAALVSSTVIAIHVLARAGTTAPHLRSLADQTLGTLQLPLLGGSRRSARRA